MELYRFNWKNNLKKMDRQEACIYKAALYELKESSMLENLINSQGKSPLLQSNGRYIYYDWDYAGNNYTFYEQYKIIKHDNLSDFFYIAYDNPFNALVGIEIASKNRIPIVIERLITYYHETISGVSLGKVRVTILNEEYLAPLVFVLKASSLDTGETHNINEFKADLLIKKYTTEKIVQSLESQKCCYDEVRKYLSRNFSPKFYPNIEELQQRKLKEIEKANQEYQIYLQNHEQEELDKAEKIEIEREELKKIVRRLRKPNEI